MPSILRKVSRSPISHLAIPAEVLRHMVRQEFRLGRKRAPSRAPPQNVIEDNSTQIASEGFSEETVGEIAFPPRR